MRSPPRRYEQITATLSEQLARSLRFKELIGSRIDALKLVSSLTFFRVATERLANNDPASTTPSPQPSISSSSMPPRRATHRAPAR